MKRVKEEAEVIVRLDFAGGKVHIHVVAGPAMAHKMEKLYGASKDGRNTARSARWEVPLRAVSFRSLQSLSRTRHRMGSFAPRSTVKQALAASEVGRMG